MIRQKYYGGPDHAATITKNIPPKANYTHQAYYRGACMLLNEGEWFRYTADGYTYITVTGDDLDDLAFDVYDASTLT